MAYQATIPTGTVNLDEDYLNIQANFSALDTTFGIDHLPFSNTTPNFGFHTQVHFNANIGSPTLGGAVGLMTPNTDVSTQTFPFWTNASGTTQMMGICSLGGNGYATTAGGLMIQWGNFTPSAGSPSSGTVFFPTAFVGNCFLVLTQITNTNPTPGNVICYIVSKSKPSFNYIFNGSFNQTVYYVALGR